MEKSPCQTTQAHILVIAQDRDILALLRTMLASKGYQVTTAVDGLDGLERLRQGNFQLILTDLSVARISGWELGRIVKRTAPAVPVALVTGWEFGAKPDHSPFDAIFSKPLHFDEFRGAVHNLIHCNSAGAQLIEMN